VQKIGRVIVSEQAIPYHKNGSWSQRIEYLLKSELNAIDYYICSKTNQSLHSTTTFFRVEQNKSKWIIKWFKNYRYKNFTNALYQLLDTNDHLIVCVIDNVKLKTAITDFIKEKNLKAKITLLFYNCGFSYYFDNQFNKEFYGSCDEVIFLTESAYQYNKNKYIEFTPEVTVLHNPVDKSVFKSVNFEEKKALKRRNKLEDNMVYLWLSHDRPNKGLSMVLNAWNDWQKPANAILVVVGSQRNETIENVRFIGTIPSNEVAQYYQMADVFLFSPLVKEGFGLSLAQAMTCGCYCIVANNGGVTDFFKPSNGMIIQSPNQVHYWVESMELAYQKVASNGLMTIDENQIVDMDHWCTKFLSIFDKWEKRLTKKSV
jgi:L-malate glycosyltransferase